MQEYVYLDRREAGQEAKQPRICIMPELQSTKSTLQHGAMRPGIPISSHLLTNEGPLMDARVRQHSSDQASASPWVGSLTKHAIKHDVGKRLDEPPSIGNGRRRRCVSAAS